MYHRYSNPQTRRAWRGYLELGPILVFIPGPDNRRRLPVLHIA